MQVLQWQLWRGKDYCHEEFIRQLLHHFSISSCGIAETLVAPYFDDCKCTMFVKSMAI